MHIGRRYTGVSVRPDFEWPGIWHLHQGARVELHDLAIEIDRLPAATVADPEADTAALLARWLTAGFARITPEDVAMARIAGMAFLPQVAGLVTMLAMALWPGGSQQRKIVSGKFPN